MIVNLETARLTGGACAGLAWLALQATSFAASDDSFAIQAARVHIGTGQVLEHATVVVADGKIVSIEEAGSELPEGLALTEHDGDLSAGLIALHDYSGAAGENTDSTRTILPDADLAHAFQPAHSDFERLVAEGITSIVLAPGTRALAGGVTAVVKTHGGRVLKRRAHLALSLSSVSLPFDQYPTSYAGALGEFDARLEAGQGAFGEAQAGELPVLIRANGQHEVQRAVAFAAEHGLKGAIVGGSRSGELAASIHEAGLAVVYRPFSVGMETRSLRSVAMLADAGVVFGFGLEAPYRHAASLRLGAAACVREGLDPQVALRALTADAARIAGVDASVGVVAPGLDADLVLWSGDPLDLGSSVAAVYIDGVRVHGEDE